MTTINNIGLITVLTISVRNSTLDVIATASLQKTSSNPLLPHMPVDDATMLTQVGSLQTTYAGFKAKPQLFTESQVMAKKLIVVASYNRNAGYIQGVARQLAITNGDVNSGINLVEVTSYKIKKSRSTISHTFKLTNAGQGSVKVTTIAVAKRAGYIRQYGATTAKGVPPTTTEELLFSLEIAINVSNLNSATVYAFREAAIVPVPRKTNTDTNTDTEKKATPTISGKAHQINFNHGNATHYNWSEWQYIATT